MALYQLICGKLINAPLSVKLGGIVIGNPSMMQLWAAGYKPLVVSPQPEYEPIVGDTMYDAQPTYAEETDCIRQDWEIVETVLPDAPEAEAEFTIDDIIEYLGELEYRQCLLELGVTEDDLQIMP